MSDGHNRSADDAKIMYCCKYNRDGTMTVSRMGLDGQDEKGIWNIDFEGTINVYRRRLDDGTTELLSLY